MKHIEAQDLVRPMIIRYEGETYHVMNSVYDNNTEHVNLWLSPTNGLDPDRYLAFPPQFSFELIELSKE